MREAFALNAIQSSRRRFYKHLFLCRMHVCMVCVPKGSTAPASRTLHELPQSYPQQDSGPPWRVADGEGG